MTTLWLEAKSAIKGGHLKDLANGQSQPAGNLLKPFAGQIVPLLLYILQYWNQRLRRYLVLFYYPVSLG